MTIGERIKELRKSLGLTLEEFGKKLGVGKSAISNIENGSRNLTDQMSLSIRREFNVREEWLRDGIGEMFEPAAADELDALAKEYGLSEGEKILIEHYIKLDEGSRRAVIDFIVDTASALSGGHPFKDVPEDPEELEEPDDVESDAG